MRTGIKEPSEAMAMAMARSLGRGVWIGALVCVAAGVASSEERLVDGIAAQVGSEIVLVSEVEELAAPILERMRSTNVPKGEMARLRKEVLEHLIEARLMENIVEQLDLAATPEEVDLAIETIARETGLTISQLASSVAGYGMSFEGYRAKIKSEIERNKVLNTMVRSHIRIDEEEVMALFLRRYAEQESGGQEVHLRHMVVSAGGTTMRNHDTACQMVADAHQKIVTGEASFADLAQQISDVNPQTGGDLGWIHQYELANWMNAAVKTLDETHRLSRVIEMPFGCNLLYLVEQRDFKPVSFADAREKLENEIFARKTEEEYGKWVGGLREQTYIERKGIYAKSDL